MAAVKSLHRAHIELTFSQATSVQLPISHCASPTSARTHPSTPHLSSIHPTTTTSPSTTQIPDVIDPPQPSRTSCSYPPTTKPTALTSCPPLSVPRCFNVLGYLPLLPMCCSCAEIGCKVREDRWLLQGGKNGLRIYAWDRFASWALESA